MTTQEQILDAWRIHNRINLYLLESIPEECLADSPKPKGRSVAEMFAHLHNVRLLWLKSAAPDLMQGMAKLEKGEELGRDHLVRSLELSSEAIATLLERACAEERVRGFKPHPVAFHSYLVAHEAHHRGQIVLVLKQAGHAVDKKVQFGLWEWGVR